MRNGMLDPMHNGLLNRMLVAPGITDHEEVGRLALARRSRVQSFAQSDSTAEGTAPDLEHRATTAPARLASRIQCFFCERDFSFSSEADVHAHAIACFDAAWLRGRSTQPTTGSAWTTTTSISTRSVWQTGSTLSRHSDHRPTGESHPPIGTRVEEALSGEIAAVA